MSTLDPFKARLINRGSLEDVPQNEPETLSNGHMLLFLSGTLIL